MTVNVKKIGIFKNKNVVQKLRLGSNEMQDKLR